LVFFNRAPYLWRNIYNQKNDLQKEFNRVLIQINFVDILEEFNIKCQVLESHITSTTPLNQDIDLIKEYRRTIKDFSKILKIRIRSLKEQIKELKMLERLTFSGQNLKKYYK
jgi:hypothetical protein